jgi:predicted amidohydrolase
MARIVKAALLQTEWTGDKESMIDKHEAAAREAAKQGAQIMCFQELFYGPYFCQEQDPKYFSYTNSGRPNYKALPSTCKRTEHGARVANVRNRSARFVLQHRSGY